MAGSRQASRLARQEWNFPLPSLLVTSIATSPTYKQCVRIVVSDSVRRKTNSEALQRCVPTVYCPCKLISSHSDTQNDQCLPSYTGTLIGTSLQ